MRIRLCVSVRVHTHFRDLSAQVTVTDPFSNLSQGQRLQCTATVTVTVTTFAVVRGASEVATCRSARVPVGGGAATLPDALPALTMLCSVLSVICCADV